ncbi:MAG TPA: ferritin, partial [Caulobacter sp.]|nr:ferritin [Caulobacter sp.]
MARKAAATTGEKPAKARKGSKTTLSEANLVDLGPERLAAILLDLSSDSHVKRVLRLELFAESSSEGLALEISKRLATIGKSSSRIHWRKRAAFARDLDLHRKMIERLAEDDATAALDLMLDLLDLATPVLDRLSQAEGPIGDVFLEARDGIGAIAAKAMPDPIALADRIARLLRRDDYAQFGPLVNALSPALGETGQAHLRQALEKMLAARSTRSAHLFDAQGAIYKDALRRLADASGDVEAFEATFAPE